jgi:hypothetical protein
VQAHVATDGRHAGAIPDSGEDECSYIRVALPLGDLGRHRDDLAVSALSARLGHVPGRHRGSRERGLPAALLREGPATSGGRRITSEISRARPLAARGAALADGGLEQQARRERSRAQLAGLGTLQGLAALEAERLAVLLLGPAVRG